MNLFLGVIIIIVSTVAGLWFSNKYRERKDFFVAFSDFNSRLKNEVLFSQNTVNKIISDFSDKPLFYENINDVLIKKKEYKNLKFLSDDENNFFSEYILKIGKNDKSTETMLLTEAEKTISEKMKTANLESEKYKKAYLKIGFLFGLMLMIALL